MAVQQLCCGKVSGVDRLPPEFYKTLWTLIGEDLFEVLIYCLDSGTSPLSCTRAVLPLYIQVAGEEQEEENGALLSFRTPVLQDFTRAVKKALSTVSVKVLNRTSFISWCAGVEMVGCVSTRFISQRLLEVSVQTPH